MTPNPILRVLSTFNKSDVKALLIGGQACIIYGAAEFSRDSDFAVLADPDNLSKLQNAINELHGELIYFPEFKIEYLQKGHAVHFRCKREDVSSLRVDLLAKMRGCDDFEIIWNRRTILDMPEVGLVNVISLQDLVRSKKTQRDKDWLMIKRLVENDFAINKDNPSDEKIKWWLIESRTPENIINLCSKYPALVRDLMPIRPLLSAAISADRQDLELKLILEEKLERQNDTAYWAPLKKELESLRHLK